MAFRGTETAQEPQIFIGTGEQAYPPPERLRAHP